MSDEDGDRHRILFEMSYYSENKSAVKAPIKALDLTWQFLGREGGDTKGRYSGDDIQIFVQYSDQYADFTVWGEDEDKVDEILDAWSQMPTVSPDEAPPSPAEQEEAKEVRIWRFKQPVQREGEPDALFENRLEAWKEKDPRRSG